MPKNHAPTALLGALALAAAACGPATSSRYPSAIVTEPTTISVPTIIYNYNAGDPDNPALNLHTPHCAGTRCTFLKDPVRSIETWRTRLIGGSISLSQVTRRDNATFFRNDQHYDNGLKVWRLLARGDHTAFALEHLHSRPDFPKPHQILTAIASGELKPDPGTPIPSGTWSGTAAIHTMHAPETAYLAKATLVVQPQPDDPGFARTGWFRTSTPEPRRVDEAPQLRALSYPVGAVGHVPGHLSNPNVKHSLEGSFHGANHEVVVIAFSNTAHPLIGGAILYRLDDDESN